MLLQQTKEELANCLSRDWGGFGGGGGGAKRRPLEAESCTRHFKFPGQGQRNTPVADARGIVEILVSGEGCACILQTPALA